MDNKRRNDITVKEGRPPITRADVFSDNIYLCKVRFNIYVQGYSEPCVFEEPYLTRALMPELASNAAWSKASFDTVYIDILVEDENNPIYSYTFEVVSTELYQE